MKGEVESVYLPMLHSQSEDQSVFLCQMTKDRNKIPLPVYGALGGKSH
jgi:hypothetical protein